MFEFTKNLYNKVTDVFASNNIIRFMLVSVIISILLNIYFCNKNKSIVTNEFGFFYKVYGILKFIILAVNLLLFGRILWMAIGKITDGVIGILKICIVSFILVCVTSLQVLFTDFFLHKYDTLEQALCVINSYQV